MFGKTTAFTLAILLVFSFVTHTVSFDHYHPGEFGDELHAYFHGEDRKLWAVLVSVILLALIIFSAVLNLETVYFSENNLVDSNLSKVFSPLIC